MVMVLSVNAASLMDGFTDPEDTAFYLQFGHPWR